MIEAREKRALMRSVGHVETQKVLGVTFSYRLLRREPYIRRDGEPSELLVWEGTCPVCNAAFEATSGATIRNDMPRGCPAHRPWHKTDERTLAHGVRARAVWGKNQRRNKLRKRSEK